MTCASSTRCGSPKMVACLDYEDAGIVGARLLYPQDRTLQHAGVIIGLCGPAGHWFRDEPATEPGPWSPPPFSAIPECRDGRLHAYFACLPRTDPAPSTRIVSRSPIMTSIFACAPGRRDFASSGRPSQRCYMKNPRRAEMTNHCSICAGCGGRGEKWPICGPATQPPPTTIALSAPGTRAKSSTRPWSASIICHRRGRAWSQSPLCERRSRPGDERLHGRPND